MLSEIKQSQTPKAKHVGSFLLLMFIATFRPVAIWPSFSISLEPFAVLAIGLLLFYKIVMGVGIRRVYQQYRVELYLLTLYFLTCFWSLYLNQERYENGAELVRYGFTFIIISAAFPACILLFSLPNTNHSFSISRFRHAYYIPWVGMGLISLLAIWQWLDSDSSEMLTQFFISGETKTEWRMLSLNSIFMTSTDLASVLAIIVVVGLIVIRRSSGCMVNRWLYVLVLAAVVLAIIAGVLGGKRIFILTLLFSFVLFFITADKLCWRKKLIFLLVGFVFINICILLFPTYSLSKLMLLLPYLEFIKNGTIPELHSFIPQINSETFGPRLVIWQHAIASLDGHWWFGISNGGLRLGSTLVEQNSHNVFLQVLVDAGIVGFVLLLLLLAFYFKRSNDNTIKVLTPLFICLALTVDYFPDHSLPWIIMVSYLIMLSWQKFDVPNGNKS